MSFTFTGVNVTIYGARRCNHGEYRVTLDDDAQEVTESGYACGPESFRQVLFEAHGLEQKAHSVVVQNREQAYFDVDYVRGASSMIFAIVLKAS